MKALIVEDSSTLCAIYEAYLAGLGLEIQTRQRWMMLEQVCLA